MNKITKILVSMFFASILAMPLQAGELSVTGGATATITKGGAESSAGSSIGVSNELAFSASGELDNGYTWKYVTELDNTSTITDDVALTISGPIGTIGFFAHEGGLRAEDIAVGAVGVGKDYASTMTWEEGYSTENYGNIQFHTPSGLLPLGTSIKVGYVPSMQNSSVQSAKGTITKPASEATGRDLTQVNVSLAPIDGVTIKSDAAWTGGESGSTGRNGTEQGVSGNVQVNYASGPFKVGYAQGASQPAIASGALIYYENKSYGASFAVNENLVISYNYDESEKNTRVAVANGGAAGAKGTRTSVTSEQDTYQIAYTMGGMTIGYSMAEVSNADYSNATGTTENVNILSVAMSF